MSKNAKNKNTRKRPAHTTKGEVKKQTKQKVSLVSPLVQEKLPYLIVALLAFLLYANTIPHKYAFDDSIVITSNNFTKSGLAGIPQIMSTDFLTGMWGKQMKMYEGGRYRPLSLVTYAIEYAFLGENPHISHLINALLYALTAFLLYIVLQKLFAKHPWGFGKDFEWYFSLPFIITALYIAHPIHTEVVANIKGRDEIMTMLGALAAWWYSIRYIESFNLKYLAYSGIMLFLSMLSKESGITFLAVIPLSLYVFTPTDRKKIITASVPLLIASMLFLRIRSVILGGMPDNDIPATVLTDAFVGMATDERYATTFYTFWVYLKLLFFPHPLTYDYYPYYIPIKHFADWEVVGAIVLHLALGLYALWRLPRKSIFSFGILFFWITFSVYSNLVFSVGVFMSERFVYMASLGFIVSMVTGVAYLGEKLLKSQGGTKIMLAGFVLMLLGFSIKTIDRNFAWKDSFTLFTTDAKVSGSKSFKSAAGAGELLLFKARKTENETEKNLYYDQAIGYFETVLRIFPSYIYVIQYMGDAQLERHKDYKKALEYYATVLPYRPNYNDTYKRIKRIFDAYPYSLLDADYRIKYWEDVIAKSPRCAERFEVNADLGRLYGAFKNNLEKSLYHLKKAESVQPNNPDVLSDLGTAYSMQGQYKKAVTAFEKALKTKPNDKQLWINVAQVYKALGQSQKAQQATQRAAALK